MRLDVSLIGALLSVGLLVALAVKWRLAWLPSAIGIIVTVLVGWLAVLWAHRQLDSAWMVVAAILAQAGISVGSALVLAMACFWRDPERIPPEQSGAVLSAADGKVIYIEQILGGDIPLVTKGKRQYRLHELTGTSLLGDDALLIGIEMNLLNVHVNRCPIPGMISLIKHIRGKFISLRREEAPFINARCTTAIENATLTVLVVQVASRLVRRVETYLAQGETVSAGQRLGMIRFGSLVGVVIPNRKDIQVLVKPGDRVKAGISVLARYGQ